MAKLFLNRRAKGLLGRIYRAEGGAVVVDLASDLDPSEVAAIMSSISDYCKARGWNPGRLAVELSNLEMTRRGMVGNRVS